MKLIRLLTLVFFIGACKAQPQSNKLKTNKDGNTLLWEVSGKGIKNASYLFGTFHLLCRNDIHFSNQLKEAVKNSTELYLEIDMDDPSTLIGAMGVMKMKGGKELKNVFKPDEYKRVEGFFKDSLHATLAMFSEMKPFFLEAMLYPKMMPCKTISGVEEELMKIAKSEKKEIQGLETLAFQASVFDSIPYEEQAMELLKTIDSLNSYRHFFDTMATVYKNQQLNEIDVLLNKSEYGMVEHQDILLNNRNKNWVNQLKTIMNKGAVFVAVGAGHLVGEQGLIALLRKEGYTLRPIENK